ncbi:septal ring lytic transglycosylase RlpA family protein [Gammaproteobacteria bacterium AS21]|jgi:rare lipoprotein A
MDNYKMLKKLVAMAVIALFVVGCANNSVSTKKKTNEGRYKVDQDYGPDSEIDVSHVKNAVPKVEPLSRGGNRSEYEVLGKNYKVLPASKGFKERGGASWYGKKFHGYLTANGEKYDMFAMTAAHKSLPLPTYLKVTNLANQKHVIVRVNDRGPFHKGRVVDLSYAAASKLGMLNHGTAQVEIEAIDPVQWSNSQSSEQNKDDKSAITLSSSKLVVVDNLVAAKPIGNNGQAKKQLALAQQTTQATKNPNNLKQVDSYKGIHYVQVGVYSTGQAAHAVTKKIDQFELPVLISEVSSTERKLFKVIVGPMQARSQTSSVINDLAELGFPGAHLIDLPK